MCVVVFIRFLKSNGSKWGGVNITATHYEDVSQQAAILGKLCFCKLFQQSFLSPSSFVLSAVVMHALVGFLEKVSISAQAADACNTSLMAANDMLWESLRFLKSRFRKKT